MEKKIFFELLSKIAKKLVIVLIISMSIIIINIRIKFIVIPNSKTLTLIPNIFSLFECILYIYYTIYFIKNQVQIYILINSNNEINTIT